MVLCSVCFLLCVVRIVYPYFIEKSDIVVKNLPLTERNSFGHENQYGSVNSSNARENISEKMFMFDPNTVTLKELIALGFREKTAGTLLKFRKKGFVFKQKEDLKKVYGVSEKHYAALAPYILITKSKITESKEEKKTFVRQAAKIIELNGADSVLLLEIKGVGPSFAKRIIKYRSLLGGYVKVEQLKEVYGFTEQMYEQIKPQVSVNDSLIRKINLNSDDFKTVNRHPYISYELTKTIFDWRRKTSITALNVNTVISDNEVLQKVLPYLAF